MHDNESIENLKKEAVLALSIKISIWKDIVVLNQGVN